MERYLTIKFDMVGPYYAYMLNKIIFVAWDLLQIDVYSFRAICKWFRETYQWRVCLANINTVLEERWTLLITLQLELHIL